MIKYCIPIFLLLLQMSAFGQMTQDQIDSLLNKQFPDQEIEQVVVVYRDEAEQAKLRRDVLRAYPYALRAASIINQIEENTKEMHRKKYKRKYLKQKENELKEQFEGNLRKLTKTQGRYMVRMINRETGTTVYDLIKEYKGGINARFWQIIAKKFDSDLKSEFDGANMESIDYEIELIINELSPLYRQSVMRSVTIEPPSYRELQ